MNNEKLQAKVLKQATSSSNSGFAAGQLVRSIAGRDKGKHYLVLAVEEKTLILADGRKRPAEQPKIKNMRHVQRVNKVAADLAPKADGKYPSNERIREAINNMLSKQVEEGE